MTIDDKKRRIDNTRPILAQMVLDIFGSENNTKRIKEKTMGIGVSKNALIITLSSEQILDRNIIL